MKTDYIIVIVIWLMAVFAWSQPILTNHIPYGEYDTSNHYTIAEYMASTNTAMVKVPYYLEEYSKVGFGNTGALWYPPQYHTSAALFGIFAQDSNLGVYAFFAMSTTLIITSIFFLVRKFYGIVPATLSAFMLAWSPRDYFSYLWGQIPQQAALAFIPVIMYCFYMYMKEFVDSDKPKKGFFDKQSIYLYITSLLLAVQFFMHPQFFLQSCVIIGIYYLMMVIKHKQLFLRYAQIGIALVILIGVIASLSGSNQLSIFLGYEGAKEEVTQARVNVIGRLFSWYQTGNTSLPAMFVDYGKMHGNWTFIPLIIGLIYLLFKRRDTDLVFLSWFVGYYILIHIDILGFARVHRFYAGEAHLFYPLVALGLWYLPTIVSSFIKISKKHIEISRYVLAVAALTAVIFMSAIPSYNFLSEAYNGIQRLSAEQVTAAEWMKNNIPETSEIRVIGSPSAISGLILPSIAKQFWYQAVSYRYTAVGHRTEGYNFSRITHVIFDYTDIFYGPFAMQDKQALQTGLINDEMIYNESPLVYKTDLIRIYNIKDNSEDVQ
ncbi:hypothetical protein K9M79_06965 [Candidatus Woesearchaeota archaeon]|nr:hypothetical protein [Candidatus Woesearchaeota archaeon]